MATRSVTTEEIDAVGSQVAIGTHRPKLSRPGTLFYGWFMLPLAMLVMIGTSPGQTYGITFFNAKFQQAFQLGHAKLSAIYLIATVLASLALPYIGGLSDRFGLRRSILFAVAGMALVCGLASQIQGTLTLFVAFLCLRMIGPGTLVLLANNTLAAWFDRRLGMAIGVMQLTMAATMAIVPAILLTLIDAVGWRPTYLILAGLLGVGLLPLLAMFYRASPTELGQTPDGEEPQQSESELSKMGIPARAAMGYRAFWILLAAAAIWALIGTGLVFHLDALVRELRLEQSDVRMVMVTLAIGMAIAQIVGGLLADHVSPRLLVTLAVGLIAAGSAILIRGELYFVITGFSVFGLGQGLMTIVSGTVWPRYFGRAHLGKIRGIALTAAVAGSSLGPLVMGISVEYLESFVPSLWLFAATAATIAIACLWATPPESDQTVGQAI